MKRVGAVGLDVSRQFALHVIAWGKVLVKVLAAAGAGTNPWLIDMLQEYGCREIVITQPDHRPKKKTDRRDASFLSNLLWINRQRLAGGRRAPGMRRIDPPTPSEVENRQLTAIRQVLTKKRTAVLNALHKVLRKHNLEQDRPTKLFQTKKVRRWLAEMHLSEIDRLEVNQLLEQWAMLDEHLQAVDEKIESGDTIPIVAIWRILACGLASVDGGRDRRVSPSVRGMLRRPRADRSARGRVSDRVDVRVARCPEKHASRR